MRRESLSWLYRLQYALAEIGGKLEPDEYDVLAEVEERHWWHVGMRKLSEAYLASAQLPAAADVLDAGCGTGGNAELLGRFGRAFGIDDSFLAVRHGRSRFPGRTIVGSVEALPFAPETFDFIASLEVLYHVRVGDETLALAEAARVLRKGGKLLLRLPAFPSLMRLHDRRVHTRRRYRLREVAGMLEKSGFRVLRATYVNAVLFPVVVVRVLLERLFPALEREGSELELPDRFMNRLLGAPLAFEAAWLRRRGGFPFGLSVLCLGEKNG